jgi:hypothetical protein
VALIDTGSFGMRPLLSSRGLEPKDVTDLPHWRRRPGTIVVPGHDVPMVLEGGKPHYIGKREAAITAWYGDDMETTMLFKLTVE